MGTKKDMEKPEESRMIVFQKKTSGVSCIMVSGGLPLLM